MPTLSLRDKVEIQNPTNVSSGTYRTPSGSGYETVETVRADVSLDDPGEQIRSGRHEAEQTGTVRMRERDDVHDETRFIWKTNGDRTLNVVETVSKGRMGRWMEAIVYVDRQTD